MKIIRATDFQKARNLIKLAEKPIVFTSFDDELNRKVLEKENLDILLINLRGRKDYSKQRNSGFNSVMAKLAKKKNIIIGINLDELLDSGKIEKSKILAEIQQNVFLCKKNKLKMTFISEKSKQDIYDLRALGLMLGMPTWMLLNFN